MADRAGYDQPENIYINNHPTSGEGTLPSYQAIEAQQQTGYDQPSIPYESTSYAAAHVLTILTQWVAFFSLFAYHYCWTKGAERERWSGGQVLTVSRQSRPVGAVTVQTTTPDYMIPSVLVCICSFWPTRLCAIYYAKKAKNLEGVGDYVGARRMSIKARMLLFSSIVLGIIYIAVAIVGVVSLS